MCGGTKVPGGKVACQANELSDKCFSTYVWPRIFQTMPSIPVPALVTPALNMFAPSEICLFHECQPTSERRKTLELRCLIVNNIFDAASAPADLPRVSELGYRQVNYFGAGFPGC